MTDKKHITINIIQGNLTSVDSPAYVLGVFEEIAPKAALLTVDRLLGGQILDMYRANQIDARLGVVTSHPTPTSKLKANRVVLAGMGGIDTSRSRSLKRVGQSVARHFEEWGESELTTVPLGLGSGHSVDRVVAYYILGILDTICERGSNASIDTIHICDFDAANCEALSREIERATTGGRFADAAFNIVKKDMSAVPGAAMPKDEHLNVDPIYLQVRMGEHSDPDAEHVHVETTLILPGGGASIDQRSKQVPAVELRKLLASFNGKSSIDHELGQELARKVISQKTIDDIVTIQKGAEHPIMLLHDSGASVVPWEAMSLPGLQQPATRLPVSRRLMSPALPQARLVTSPSPDEPLRVLLIVDPTDDLDGACREGERVEALLTRTGNVEVVAIWKDEAQRNRLLAEFATGKHQIVHYAGHAFFDPANPGRSGLICNGGEVLTGHDIAELEAFPKMIFLNACESGRIRRGRDGRRCVDATPALHVERGTGLAQAFLRGGVRHFLGTYWPVGDHAADTFSSEFYRRLVEGESIGNAVMRARQAVYRIPSSDWADYIHYGDPTDNIR